MSTSTTSTRSRSLRQRWLMWFQNASIPKKWLAQFVIVGLVTSFIMVPVLFLGSRADASTPDKIDHCVLENPDRPCWATAPNVAHRVTVHTQPGTPRSFQYPARAKYIIKAARAQWVYHHPAHRGDACQFSSDPNIGKGECWWRNWRNMPHGCIATFSGPYECSGTGGAHGGESGDDLFTYLKDPVILSVNCGGLMFALGVADGPTAAGWGGTSCLWGSFWAHF